MWRFIFLLLSVTALAGAQSDFEKIRSRYQEWVLGTPAPDLEEDFATKRFHQTVSNCRRTLAALKKLPASTGEFSFYNTLKKGPDSKEVSFLIKAALPHLSTAYQLPPSGKLKNPYHQNPKVLTELLRVFDHLHQRGFRKPMLMPWKAAEVKVAPKDKGVITDFHLRTSGFALATFLMRDELAQSNRLEKALETCREILTHDEKFGPPNALDQNADGIRVVVNTALPYALAAGDKDRLLLLTRQLERTFIPESDASDTLKPDGLGFHHRAAYPGGYAAFAYQQSALAAWILRDTRFACPPKTIAHLEKGLSTLRLISQKYEMHRSLAGRLAPRPTLISVMTGYAFLADLDHPRRKKSQAILARLADPAFLAGKNANSIFKEHRNEIPPGPGGISQILKIIAKAHQIGPEKSPSGHWSFNYGPLAVHRRENWMATVKGHSKYFWAFERSLTDGRMDERRENVFGFHDGSGSLAIFSKGSPVTAYANGFRYGEGWDWTLIPGTTARHLPAQTLLELDTRGRKFNRPFSPSTFAGGVTIGGKNGLFAMDYQEVSPDERKHPLTARKSYFFFDNLILALTTGIKNGDDKWPVRTTLFQSALDSLDGKTPLKNFDPTKSHHFLDPQSNGYYLPAGQKITLRHAQQDSFDHRGLTPASGNFATAWIDHGKSPSNANAEFAILVNTTPEKLQTFANNPDQHYHILQQNKSATIVESPRLGLTAYVIASANTDLSHGQIKTSDTPILAISSLEKRDLHLAICNPDLGWTEGSQYNYRKGRRKNVPPIFEPIPMPVRLVIKGQWQLPKNHPDLKIVRSTDTSTTLEVASRDAQTFEAVLIPKNP